MSSFLIHRTGADDRTPNGTMGRPVIGFYRQIRALVTDRLGSEVAGYFAEPSLHDDDAGVDWFAESSEAPKPLAAVSRPVRREALTLLKDWRDQLNGLVEREANNPDLEKQFRVLKLVLNEPSSEDVFVADGKPVVVNWGYLQPDDFVPINYNMGGKVVRGDQPDPVMETSRTYFGMSVLTLCMIVALLLAVLAGGLRAAGVFGEPVVFASPEAGEGGQSRASELAKLQAQNARSRLQIEELEEQYVALLLDCAAQCADYQKNGVPVTPPVPPGPRDDDELEKLIVPDDAVEKEDFSFLEGIWRSKQDLLSLVSNPDVSVDIEYHINADGTGTRHVFAGEFGECIGDIKVKFDEQKNLIIEETTRATCALGNMAINRYTVTCEINSVGEADCHMAARDSAGKDVPVELGRVK